MSKLINFLLLCVFAMAVALAVVGLYAGSCILLCIVIAVAMLHKGDEQ